MDAGTVKQSETLLAESDNHIGSSINLGLTTIIRKRGQAAVWGWFEKVLIESGDKPTHSKCSLCGTKVSIINSATTPMINHMKRHHIEVFEKVMSQKIKEKKFGLAEKSESIMSSKSDDTTISREENTTTLNGEFSLQSHETTIKINNEQSDVLGLIKNEISQKHPTLNVHQALSSEHVPFIHIWKPISKLEGFQGMPFLPCFHIIGTILYSNPEMENKKKTSDCIKRVLFQLHSFNGKVIADEYVTLQEPHFLQEFELVTKMANDQLQLCKGVEDIDRQRFVQFIRSCKLPSILAKVRSVFLIEQLMGCVVLRSRLCKFVLFEDPNNDVNNLPRCDECNAFEYRSDTWMEDVEDMTEGDRLPLNEARLASETQMNYFEKVYLETSAADMQELAVFQKVQEMYKQKGLRFSASQNKESKPVCNIGTGKLCNIKSEPEEANVHESSPNINGDDIRSFNLASPDPISNSLLPSGRRLVIKNEFQNNFGQDDGSQYDEDMLNEAGYLLYPAGLDETRLKTLGKSAYDHGNIAAAEVDRLELHNKNIWNWFEKTFSDDGSKTVIAKCRLCDTEIPLFHTDATELQVHLEERHSESFSTGKRKTLGVNKGNAPIWEWFEKVILENGEKPTHAKCTKCNAQVSIFNSATTPMINHMKRHHTKFYKNEVLRKIQERKEIVRKKKAKQQELASLSLEAKRLYRTQINCVDEEKHLRNNETTLKRRKQKRGSFVAQKSTREFSKTCLICLHTFHTKNWFKVDQSRHEQVFDLTQSVVCPLCNITIQNKCMVTTHFEQEHGNQNVTCCCECLEIIPKDNTDKLRRHILNVHHSASEAFVCPDCGKECSSKVQLEVHMAEIHNSGRTVAMCQHCGKSFGHLTKLKVHLKRHQPRDLQCPHCEKKFVHRDRAKKHLWVHTGIKPYKCILCQYISYSRYNVLAAHFPKSHGRKGTISDIVIDIAERDMMHEIALVEVEAMMADRKSKLQIAKHIESNLEVAQTKET